MDVPIIDKQEDISKKYPLYESFAQTIRIYTFLFPPYPIMYMLNGIINNMCSCLARIMQLREKVW